MAYLPGYGQVNDDLFKQMNPIEKNYSPRLFGAPPQLTSLCDMRIDSGYDNHEGETGDWYRNKVLKNAQIANFFVGRALFTGGYNGLANILRQFIAYQKALQRYNIFGTNDAQVQGTTRDSLATLIEKNQNALNTLDSMSTEATPTETTSEDGSVQYVQLDEIGVDQDLNNPTASSAASDDMEVLSEPDEDGNVKVRIGARIVIMGVSNLLGQHIPGSNLLIDYALNKVTDHVIETTEQKQENNQALMDAYNNGTTGTDGTDDGGEDLTLPSLSEVTGASTTTDESTGVTTVTTEQNKNLFLNGKAWLEQLERSGTNVAEFLNIDYNTSFLNLDELEGVAETGTDIGSQVNTLDQAFNTGSTGGAGLTVPLLHSLSMGQSYYTFEADWYTYINNVKMMINAAIVMLGLQSATVRIGDKLYPIGLNVRYEKDTDVWTNYRYITPDDSVGMVTSIDTMTGDSSQYVSFMIDTVQASESYTNTTGTSKIYSTMAQGNEVGNEIAFITNSSGGLVDDAVVNLAGSAIDAAEKVMDALTFGVGKFTAAIAAGMARSYLGDHPIYPKIFSEHRCEGTQQITVRLRAARGDAYSYLTDILVPLFHILAMALPKMSTFSAGSYQYPPIVQCQIPGIWGTRLGIITSVSVTKNPDGSDISVNGYPLAVNVSMTIEDLQHCMVTTPMDQPSYFLNNQTMFDYIAQSTGVDKYRVNSAARLVTRLALAASYGNNLFYNLGSALANDVTTLVNKHTRISQY